MQTPPKNLSVAPGIGISKDYNRELMSLWSRSEGLEYQLHVRQYSIKHGYVCVYIIQRNTGSVFVEDFTLPDLASTLRGEAFCFSATCDWTSRKRQLPPEPNMKCQ